MNSLLWLVNCSDAQSALLADYLRDRGFDIRRLHKTAVYGHPPKSMPLPCACLIFGSQNSEPLIHRMRSWGFDAPLIFLFQYGGKRDCISILEAGADECVHMPISHFAFLARLHALLRRASVASWLPPESVEQPHENSHSHLARRLSAEDKRDMQAGFTSLPQVIPQ